MFSGLVSKTPRTVVLASYFGLSIHGFQMPPDKAGLLVGTRGHKVLSALGDVVQAPRRAPGRHAQWIPEAWRGPSTVN